MCSIGIYFLMINILSVYVVYIYSFGLNKFMASPVPKFPEIIRNLRKKGFILQCSLEDLRKEIILITGSYQESTLSKIISTMDFTEYIKVRGAVIDLIFEREKALEENKSIQREKEKSKTTKLTKEEIAEMDAMLDAIPDSEVIK